MKVRVDRGGCTFLPLCECGWRGLPDTTHSGALQQARHHEMRAHPGHRNAEQALDAYKRRNR